MNAVGRSKTENKTVTSSQDNQCEFREHSQESLNPIRSMRNLQRQNQPSSQGRSQNSSPALRNSQISVNHQESNLITFTPPAGPHLPQVQGAVGKQEQPKRKRSPRKKARSEWALNQKQFDQNKSQEISHISPRQHMNVFNREEPSVSY